MENKRFKIRKPRGARPKAGFPTFVLEQDNWNDHSFRTQYHLSYFDINASGSIEETLLGPVKILKRGQTAADGLLLSADFDKLDEDFCSVGQSLDYYERINALGEKRKIEVLSALRDVVHSPALVAQFEHEAGWSTSLFRDHNDDGTSFMTLARGLITGIYARTPAEDMSFSFAMPTWQAPVDFAFDAPADDFLSSPLLPERIAVLVGRNGSGKSTLLARLARVAFGTLEERAKGPLADLGRLEPPGVGFPRIITVAFSPFDSFKLPGSDSRNRKQVLKDLERGEGRFSFIGIRDVIGESTSRGTTSAPASLEDEPLRGDRLGRTRLKSIEQLADEFRLSLEKVHGKGRQHRLHKFATDLIGESALQDAHLLLAECSVDDARAAFLACSTGHKIALLIVTGLLAHIEPYSLVLVDEPETHLHPPLLAALMHALRGILREFKAFAVVATHSPVVVQESLARHVRVVRREGDLTRVVPMTGETFGESIGLISAEVFGLQTDATDFHKILDHLVRRTPDLDALEQLFLDGAMSHQARAYVMSRLSNRQKS
ncbi:AAA family ATPase [Cupriavidus sp. P-10]|uniref:AAA family ATPase n=1 Tax=Cupriavidus sp. P-10 TaxID=2027911 RepID=UPI000EE1ABEA|nr:AAA family ATPase [Cupriavidus sp. P-10]BDB27307.1 AAA family ATPase [Cupriavidus sp. P-10]